MKQDNKADRNVKKDQVRKLRPESKTKNSKAERKANDEIVQKDLKIKEAHETMNLEGSRNLVGKIFLGIILLCLAFFFVRTAIWEHSYYKEKEGSPRTPAQTVEESEPLDETEVTVEQRIEHTVPADHPRYLTIEKLNIHNSRVISMDTNDAGELDTPLNIFDVGWYNKSGKPGYGKVVVIDGHNGGPNVEGVFKHINQLYSGDEIIIERGDGQKFTYEVVENKEIPLAEADDYMHVAFTSPAPGQEALTLISCIGEWSQVQQTYLSRQFVRAVLVK